MAWINTGTITQTSADGLPVKVRRWQCDGCGKMNSRLPMTGPPPPHLNCPGPGSTYYSQIMFTGGQSMPYAHPPETPPKSTPGCRCSGCKILGWS
jgi:hypothetical protein